MEEARYVPRRRKRRGRGWMWAVLCFVAIAAGLLVSVWQWYERTYGPVDTRIAPNYGVDKPVFYRGRQLEGGAIGEGEQLKLPLALLQQEVDQTIAYESSSDSIIITTGQQVIRMVTDQLTAWVNDEPYELRFPTEQVDGVVYVPVEPLARLYGVAFEQSPDSGIVMLHKPGDVITWVGVPETAASERGPPAPVVVRAEPTVRAPIVGQLAPGEQATAWGEQAGWLYVQLADGVVGYVDERSVVWSRTDTRAAAPAPPRQPYVPRKPMGEFIMLTWEQVYSRRPDPSAFDPMPGLNVVSPTWFHVLDAEGALENRADSAFVSWAHNQGFQVWALFSNSFDPDLTAEVLSTFDRRMNMVRQLLSWAEIYNLDGINIDFENVYLKDGPLLTQFVRELTPLLHEAGLTVSIDVTFVSTNPNWSMFLDRPALAAVVDYMMVMAYDEHWASSPVAGSVASLPWVETGVRRLIDEQGVPPSKIVLGVPLYTRIWTERTADDKTTVSSRAVGMGTVKQTIADRKLEPVFDNAAGQHFVEYEEDGAKHKIWIEDDTSMAARAALVRKLQLAGMASWSRNFANDTIWKTMNDALYQPE